MKNKNLILFLKKTSKYSCNRKVDIILSPELYWVRFFDIPVSNIKDARTVVPTFFEDFLDINNYKFYIAEQKDGKYLCFAYDENVILNAIKNANLNLNQVSNIYFGQNEFSNIDAFKIVDEYFIYQDDVLVKFPKEFVDDDKFVTYNLSTLKLSKHKISIRYKSKFINNKSLYILSAIFIFISLLNFAKTYIIKDMTDNIILNQEVVKKQYKILPTMMQTKSVIKSLELKQSKQIKLREALQYLFSFKNFTQGRIQKVDFVNQNLTIYFKDTSVFAIKSYLSKKYKIIRSDENNGVVTIRIQLW